jgi:hypothetical protein
MIRQRALAWAAALALVATVQITPLPTQFPASVTALAQDDSAADAGEPTDLAVVALHCAEAPDTEALTSFFARATLPQRCAPAVGVAIAVTENGAPVPGSPFPTDVAGTLAVPVSLGSAVEVREDPESLPAGYEALTREANGVPYANPVQLNSAVAGAAVLFVNVPSPVATTLSQGTSLAEPGEPTDLAVVALNCAEAPATEALTSFFSGGTPPSGCAPAEGVAVDVTENEKSLSGNPFRTDTTGTLAVRVGLGSAVTVEEDPKSLPSGYEPLTQEANGVPYANPVELDSAAAGAAVLFVNVPSSVAAKLSQDTLAVDAGEATDLARAATLDRTGCDPAYPDERTCIAPGRPLDAPCSITDQRNFTVLAPDPRRLDADGDGIGCEPNSPSSGTIVDVGSADLYTSGDLRPAAPTRTGDVAVASSRVRTGDSVRVATAEGSRGDDWLVHLEGNRAGLWFAAPDRTSAGSLAVVSNPVFIGNRPWSWSRPNRFGKGDGSWRGGNHDGTWFRSSGVSAGNLTIASSNSGSGDGSVAIASNPIFISHGVWAWPDRGHGDDWHRRNRPSHGAWSWPKGVSIGNLTIASSDGGSGDGSVAIASNPVFIGNGLWRWPVHTREGAWFWPDRNRDDDRSRHDRLDHGVWGWPGRIAIGNLAVARSGNGNLAVVSNPVFIGNGLWAWPTHRDDDDWLWRNRVSAGNLAIARSGDGNIAIVSNPIFIGGGLWTWPNRTGNDDWRGRNRNGRWFWPSISVGNLTIASSGNGGSVAIASNPIFIGRGVWHWPGHSNNRVWLWPNRNNGHWRSPKQIGNGVWFWPSAISVGNLTIARSGSGNIAIVSNPIVITSGVWFVPPDRNHDDNWLMHRDRDHADDKLVQGEAAQAENSDVAPLTINGDAASEAPPSKIEQPDSSEQPALAVNGGLAVEPPPADSTQPPSDSATQPPAELVESPSDDSVAPPSDSYVESPSDGNVTSPPDAAVQPPPDAAAPHPDYIAPDPSYVDAGTVDPGYVAPDPGIDPSYSAPDQGGDPGYVDESYVAPEPTYVEPDYVEPNYINAGGVDPGYVDPGIVAPDPGIEPSFSASEPSFSAPEPNYVDPGMDAGYVAPETNFVAPEANYVDAGNVAPSPGKDAGNGSPGNGDAGDIAPDPGMDNAGNGDAGNVVPDAGGGRGEGGGRDQD